MKLSINLDRHLSTVKHKIQMKPNHLKLSRLESFKRLRYNSITERERERERDKLKK